MDGELLEPLDDDDDEDDGAPPATEADVEAADLDEANEGAALDDTPADAAALVAADVAALAAVGLRDFRWGGGWRGRWSRTRRSGSARESDARKWSDPAPEDVADDEEDEDDDAAGLASRPAGESPSDDVVVREKEGMKADVPADVAGGGGGAKRAGSKRRAAKLCDSSPLRVAITAASALPRTGSFGPTWSVSDRL